MIPEMIARYEYRGGRIYNKATGRLADSDRNSSGYRRVRWDRGSAGRLTLLAHRMVWMMHHGDIPDGMLVDHIDRDKLNNDIANLRLTTKSGNSQNAKFRGCFQESRSGKWRAEIKLDGKAHWLGLHETEQAARQAYLEAKRRLHPVAGETVLTED